MYDILNIDDVDFSDISDIAGSAELILARSSNPGQFKAAYKSLAKEWLLRADTVLDSLSCGDAMTLTAYYEPLHQLAFSQAASTAKLDKYRLDAFESYIRGDKTVDQYALRHTISREIDRRNPKYFGRPLQWESVCLDRWHKQFRHGASLDELSDYDTLHRVSTLLTTDLWSFETRNESRYKQNLFENYKFYLDNLDGLDYSLLIANYSLLISGTPFLTQEEYTAYDAQIRAALISSKETNRYHRQSLLLRVV